VILRRVIEHVRDQNWTAVGIDFCIVVIGVFFGIQVANWNDARAEERRGRAYAERLTADLEKDLASRLGLVAYFAAVLESVERTDALLADPQSDAQQLVVAAYRASEINYIPPSRSTWDEIVASGDAQLLQRDVARAAAEHFAFDIPRDAYDILAKSGYRLRVRNIIPLQAQKALRAGCSDVRDQSKQIVHFMPDCKLDLAPAIIDATAAALRSDPAVRANLRYQYSDVYSAHANIEADVAAIGLALAALGAAPLAAEPAQ
jgi:hypothetical protein